MASPTRAWLPSTSRRRSAELACAAVAALALAVTSGCGPRYTYPADSVPQSAEKIAMGEYQIDLHTRVVGRTFGGVFYVDKLLDASGQIPKQVHEKIGQALQTLTRVALSTDLPLDFCIVFVRDAQSANELVIARSVDDIKRAHADAIGIEESINRTLFKQSRYEPAQADAFVLEDIRLEDFLAEQTAQRIRFRLAQDATSATDPAAMALVDGHLDKSRGRRVFRYSVIAFKADEPRRMILELFKVVNAVLAGYKYADYDAVEIQDYFNRQRLSIDRQSMLDYQAKKLKDEEVLDRFVKESQSVQEAFKLFGFNLPQDPQAQEQEPPVLAAR